MIIMKLAFNPHAISSRVIGTILLLNLLMAIAVGYAIYAMNQIGGELEGIVEEDIPLTQKLMGVTVHQLEQAALLERGIRFGEILDQGNHAAEQFHEAITAFDENTKHIEAELHAAELFAEENIAVAHTPKEREEFEHVVSAIQKIEKEHKEYEHHAHQIFAKFEQGDRHNAEALAENIEAEEQQLNHEIEALEAEVGQFTLAAGLLAEEHEHDAITMMAALLVLNITLGLLIGIVVTRSISGALAKAIAGAEVIAAGDLTQELESTAKDETGQLLNSMNEMRHKLLSMLMGINGAVVQLSSAAEELSVVTEQTRDGVAQQQSETDQVVTAINEMAATADEVARNAGSAADGARQADEATQSGQCIVNDTISVIQQVARNVEDNAGVVRKLNDDSEKIGVVLDVIRGIAEQTNLLALNAAIEAARAGEQGRGFAVVADEVRTLASRTQASTQEIQAVIEELQSASKVAVQAMDQGATQAHEGVTQAAEAGKALENITTAVDSISDMNTQIASAAEEQSAVSRELERNVVNIANVVTDTSLGTEQIATASTELAALAVGLQEMVGEFKV